MKLLFTYLFFVFLLAGCNSDNKDNNSPPTEKGNQITGEIPNDPAPEAILTGEHGCDGCPDSDSIDFDLNLGNVTTHEFQGSIINAEGNGEYFLISKDGRAISGNILTNLDTNEYSIELPLFCGEQTFKTVWSNLAGKFVSVTKILTENCIAPDIRIILSWDDIGIDWELHLVKEDGRINDNSTDCTWTSCITSSPDWGVLGVETDNPKKDVDNTGNFGPENIYLSNPENQTYTIMVEHWNGNGSNESDGKVIVLTKNTSHIFSIQDLPPFHVWTVATIKWPDTTITPVNSLYDCSENWSGGCKSEIP